MVHRAGKLMPAYNVTAPDGRKFRVQAPEGATEAEILAYAKANMPAADAAPVEDPGPLMSAVIAAGRTGDKGWAGIKQLGLTVPAFLGHEGARSKLADLKAQQEAADAAYAPLAEKRPVATFLGEAAPLVAMPLLGTGIRGAALSGSLPGLVSYGTGEERLQRGSVGALGGAVGGALGAAAGRVAQPIRARPTQSATAAQQAAERLGVQLRPGEITGSRPLRWLESSLNDLPFSAGMGQRAEAARSAAINRGAAKSIGQDATELTEDVLAGAREKIGSTFNTLLSGRKITLDKAFQNEVQAITGSKVMKTLRDDSVETVIAPFRNMPTTGPVRVTGEWFQQNKTALDSAVRSAYSAGESGKARALENFEKALERAAIRSMKPDEAAAYKAAQKQWASLRLLETGKVVDGGQVMPGRLDTALTTRYGGAYKEGKIKGELADIGKMAQAYKPLPQSGTAPRAFYSGAAGMAALTEPVTAAAAFAAPPLAQKFLQSDAGRAYLTRGALEITPEIEKWLIRGGAGLLGLPATVAASR